MIRAIVGTVAVLAGFGVLESSVDASTGFGGSCKATQAYAQLQGSEQLLVRASPSPEGTVVGALARRNATTEITPSVVTLIGSESGWARIALGGGDYTAIGGEQRQLGWIPADMLAVDSRLGGAVTIYDRPGLLGHEVGKIEGKDTQFRVLGCRGEWLQVINAQQGNVWIDRWCAKPDGCRG
jgi:hypothetical protein